MSNKFNDDDFPPFYGVRNNRKRSGILARTPQENLVRYLPAASLREDPDRWSPPLPKHIRMLVGPDSKTGISANVAAKLLGISPQNFRKYTAFEGASSGQKMSFIMWHFLLHRLGVKTLSSLAVDDDLERVISHEPKLHDGNAGAPGESPNI